MWGPYHGPSSFGDSTARLSRARYGSPTERPKRCTNQISSITGRAIPLPARSIVWVTRARSPRGSTLKPTALRNRRPSRSLLSRGGVAPRTAQAAMRHSKLDLTMNVYTDPRLLDVAGAMDVLPSLPIDDPGRERAKATGTDPRKHVPVLVPDSGNVRGDLANAGKTAGSHDSAGGSVSGDSGGACQSLTSGGEKRVKGLEPSTFSLGTPAGPSLFGRTLFRRNILHRPPPFQARASNRRFWPCIAALV